MITLLHGDAREMLSTLPDQSVQTVVTSPPYWGLRSYSDDPREIGKEETPALYVAALVSVFREVWRVLRNDGTMWVNLGSSYAGSSMTGGTSSKEGSVKRADRMFKKGTEIGRVGIVPDANDTYMLRDDLTPDEIAYVLSELALHARQCCEIPDPHVAVGVDQAVTPFTNGKEV